MCKKRRSSGSATPVTASESRQVALTEAQIGKISVIIKRTIHRNCRQWCKDQQEDFVQETWARLIERLEHFKPVRGPLESFVETVVPNIVADLKRYAKAQKRCPHRVLSLDHLLHDTDLTIGESVTVLNRVTPPQGVSLNGDLQPLRMDVTEYLQKSNERDRRMAEAVMTQSIAEHARSSGIPRSTVRYRLTALRGQLRKSSLNEYLNRPGKR